MDKLRILLADDHETVRTGLRVILDAQAGMEVIGEATDGQAVIEKTQDLQPDVVLMDVSMPRLNGLQATEILRQRYPAVKIVTLTRHSDVRYLHELLLAGATGYVLKQSRAAEVLHAIRVTAGGRTDIDSAIAADSVAAPAGANASRHRGAATPRLSPREGDTLRLAARGYTATRKSLPNWTSASRRSKATKPTPCTSWGWGIGSISCAMPCCRDGSTSLERRYQTMHVDSRAATSLFDRQAVSFCTVETTGLR